MQGCPFPADASGQACMITAFVEHLAVIMQGCPLQARCERASVHDHGQVHRSTAARPASSRAIGTRNGEQET
jgi:hypothetical protein